MAELLNAFTVDVEDYFQVSAFEGCIRRDAWDGLESRVEANTHRILRILEQHQVRGTFFVLGWIASRFPQLVKEIRDAGHEIASHGFWHQLIYKQTPEEFREDIRKSRDLLQELTGTPIVAYRAPSFSITRDSLWALDILVEEGFSIDSSIFPIRHDRYGIPGADAHIRQIRTASGDLWEVPPSAARVAGCNVPTGGGYFRLYPWHFTRACLRRINRHARQPFMFYVHPWELDPDQPRVAAPFRSRLRHYINLHKTERRLHNLMKSFRLSTVSDVLRTHRASTIVPRALETSGAPHK